MASADDWIIHSTGSALGGENIASLLSLPQETDVLPGQHLIFQSPYDSKYNQYASGLTAAQLDTARRYQRDIMANQSGDAYNQINQLYGVNPVPNEQQWQQFAGKPVEQLYGYQSPDQTYREQYYGDLYGRGESFTPEQIEGALTNRYGEVVPGADMGEGWKELYHTYNKWQQEDEMFRKEMYGLQGEVFPQAEAQQRALMASGGMEAGSEQWVRSLSNIQDKKLDIEAEMAERRSALEDTSIYKSLQEEYQKLRGAKEMRGVQTTETRYQPVNKFIDATEKYIGPKYGRDSETGEQIVISPGRWETIPAHYELTQQPYEHTYVKGTETGNLQYATDEGEEMSFDDFYQSQFGATEGVANPYLNSGVSNQELSEDEKRARMIVGGAATGGSDGVV